MPIYLILSNIISVSGVTLSASQIFRKAIQYKPDESHRAVMILWNLAWAFLCAFRSIILLHPLTRLIYCALSIAVIVVLSKLKIDIVVPAFLLSFGISNVLYYIASLAIGLLSMPFASIGHQAGMIVDNNNLFGLLFYSLVSAVQLLLSLAVFQVKRFKNGFSFLLKGYAVIIALISVGAVLVFSTWISVITASNEATSAYLYLLGIFISGVGIFIWIKRGIRMFYRKKQKDRSIEILERELDEQRAENRRLIAHNDILRVANHKIQHRLAALELAVSSLSETGMEASAELAVTREDIRRATHDYQHDIGRLAHKTTLPTTKIKILDDLFSYFASLLFTDQINFKLMVNGSIPYMIEQIIEQGRLETMIGDHLQNARIAVNASENTFRSILATIGLAEDCYEFSVYDSGIPFEIDTLIRLGTQRVTTYSDTDGSGIGMMTTFETMQERNASLIIAERPLSNTDYTKCVTIRFDGKSQYIIQTNRPGEFPESDRIVLVETGA